jgi:hypothetical protein
VPGEPNRLLSFELQVSKESLAAPQPRTKYGPRARCTPTCAALRCAVWECRARALCARGAGEGEGVGVA